MAQTRRLTLASVQQWISDCGTQGAAAYPAFEILLFQMLLEAARTTWPVDLAPFLAQYTADGMEQQEIDAFVAHGGQMTTPELLIASKSFYWNRIDLDQSPLVNP